jgi:uncharacterized protein
VGPTAPRSLTLTLLPDRFAVCRLPPGDPVPAWADAGGPFVSVSRTPDELSVVCPEANVPAGVRAEAGWRCLRFAGPFAFTEVGVLAAALGPLAAAGVGVLAVSTFDTDYLLVKADQLDSAVGALRAAGHRVDAPS